MSEICEMEKTKRTELGIASHRPEPNTFPTATKVAYQLFRIPVEIGGLKTRALVDTGASASIMATFLWRRIANTEVTEIRKNFPTFKSICGMAMKPIGTYIIKMKIHPNDNSRISQIFYVLEKLTEPCILGIDFITNADIKLDSSSRRITYTNNEAKFHVIGKFDDADEAVVASKNEHKIVIGNDDCEKYMETIQEMLKGNKDIIAEKTAELGKAIGVKHSILTEGPPIFTPPRRNARTLQPTIRESIEEMLKHDIIRPSTSPYSSPIVLVNKKTGGII